VCGCCCDRNCDQGGKKTILIYAGKDATKEFKMMHQPEILTKYGPRFYIGDVVESGSAAGGGSGAASTAAPGETEVS
jgi:cytochrome b involved in lipid metabolism